MSKQANIGKWFYASAIAVFGIQHFIYAEFVATLVPAWIPWHLFFTYLVGVAFMAAALSILINRFTTPAYVMLSIMLALFILLIHTQNLYNHSQNPQGWTRALQDVVIMGTALLLAGNKLPHAAAKYLYAVPMLFLGLQHFIHADFVVAKVPLYFQAVYVWDYLVGIIIVTACGGIITNRYGGMPASMLGFFLLMFGTLYHVPLLAANIYNGQEWTATMLDAAIAGGAFAVAAVPQSSYRAINMTA